MTSIAQSDIEQQLREMNEALLISSLHQHELTEQAQQAEDALRESEQRFRTLFELGPVAVYSCDASGVIMEFNQRAAELWGRAPTLGDTDERFCGSIRMILPDGSALAHEQCPMAEVLSGTIPYARDAEVGIERPDGSRITVIVNIRPLKNERGEITGAINCFYNITERKEMERELRESEELHRYSQQAAGAGTWTWHEADGVVTWSPECYALFGIDPQTPLLYESWRNVVHPDDRHRADAAATQAMDRGEDLNVEYRIKHRARGERWLTSIGRIIDPVNRPGYMTGISLDITERKKAEKQLQLAKQEADEANCAKDMFLATLSHEVRTPLSAIVGWMQILQGGFGNGCTEADLSEGLDVIERNARAMVQLLDDVMDMSRVISGKVRMEVRPCELREVIQAGIDVVRSAARAKDIKLTAELEPAASAASCDASRMQQVVWNLLSNAIKFTPKGGKVHVALARDGADLLIQVSDTGQGIGAELLPYVFDRFRQADSSTRRRFGGLGLGLSIVKHLVELHGGTIQADSKGEGLGSTFSVRLPIRAVRTDECGYDPDADEAKLLPTMGLQVVRLDALRVLVVDDEPDARRLLVRVLREAGAVVTAAASADEAFAALAKSNPEVIVSDLGMPDRDGFDLIRQIRTHGYQAKDLPAVALSAFVQKKDQRQALLAGFQMHVAKPADPHDLTAAIACLAGRSGPAA